MRISDWSSDVCSSDLSNSASPKAKLSPLAPAPIQSAKARARVPAGAAIVAPSASTTISSLLPAISNSSECVSQDRRTNARSEEHTSELQSLMRISYAVFCLKKNTTKTTNKQIYKQL